MGNNPVGVYGFGNNQEGLRVEAEVWGPYLKKEKDIVLSFDTGAAKTQIHTPIIDQLGYSARQGTTRSKMYGAAGEAQHGFYFELSRITLLGVEFNNIEVGAFDLEGCVQDETDGLLGFDLIKRLRIEINGPAGELIIY